MALDKGHPDYSRARFPTHEIESTIESAIRQNLSRWINETESDAAKYFSDSQSKIQIYDLVRSLLTKVTVHHDKLILYINLKSLSKVVHQHLNIHLTCSQGEAVINVPYQLHRAQAGSQIIKTAGRNMFDMPVKMLKKFVQGTVWRDEHFDDMVLAAIVRREGCSRDYVGSAILSSFKIIQNV